MWVALRFNVATMALNFPKRDNELNKSTISVKNAQKGAKNE